jgi:transcriptional regulator with XRE-family HTH domain
MRTSKNVLEPYWQPSKKTVSPAEMQAFGKRLGDKMQELGYTRSSLAREAFGVQVDSDGVERVKDRDKIGLYLRGEALPGESKMRALAKTLKMTLKELAPPLADPADRPVSNKAPPKAPPELDRSLSFKSFEGWQIKPLPNGMAVLVVHQLMGIDDAAEISAMIARAAKHGR